MRYFQIKNGLFFKKDKKYFSVCNFGTQIDYCTLTTYFPFFSIIQFFSNELIIRLPNAVFSFLKKHLLLVLPSASLFYIVAFFVRHVFCCKITVSVVLHRQRFSCYTTKYRKVFDSAAFYFILKN